VETDYACQGNITGDDFSNCDPSGMLMWRVFENVFLVIFFMEAALKIKAYTFAGYWEDGWNRFCKGLPFFIAAVGRHHRRT
jgi:hypothetical protein